MSPNDEFEVIGENSCEKCDASFETGLTFCSSCGAYYCAKHLDGHTCEKPTGVIG